MKKLIFILMAVFAMAFTSCGNKAETVETVETDTTAVDSLETDSLGEDTFVVEEALTEEEECLD